MNVFDLLEDDTRPRAPPIPQATPADRMAGKRLAMIHAMHIDALNETKAMMLKVEAGELDAGTLATKIETLDMMRNYVRFGNLCGRECEFLNYHHSAEDGDIFPVILAGASDGVKAVIERLMQEHDVIHELLLTLSQNVTALLADPGAETFAQAKETFCLIDRVVRSHFGYEQTELEEALGFYRAL